MHMLKSLLVASAIFSFAFANHSNAAEGRTSNVSTTPLKSRNVAKARTVLTGISETADLAISMNYEYYPDAINKHFFRVSVVNLGHYFAYPRVIFLQQYTADGKDSDYRFVLTPVLAPNESFETTFSVPQEFIDRGAVVASVGFYGTDDDPSNDYVKIVVP